MSIYIARGDDTLGPYSPGKAAELLRRGQLRADDFAARNGDSAWVPLSTLLALEPPLATESDTRRASTELPTRRTAGPGVFVGLAVLVVVGAALTARFWPAHVSSTPPVARTKPVLVQPPAKPMPAPSQRPPTPVPVVVVPQNTPPSVPLPSAAPTVSPPVVAVQPPPPVEVPPPPAATPPAKKDCRLTGTVSFGSPGSEPTRVAGVRVAAYALDPLVPLLAGKNAYVQGELARLTAQLQMAEAERKRRLAMARDAQQAYLDASPSDPLRTSLHFAAGQAKSDVSTATANYQYFLDERDDVLDGDFYFRDLPRPTAEVQTNEEGEFALDLPTGGTYVLAARVRQTGLGDTRTHYWLLKVALEDGSQRVFPLSNDNLASSGSADSLIHTAH